ncbi:MAG: DUF2090 domain-containing protein [Patescibacteria group bacterium]
MNQLYILAFDHRSSFLKMMGLTPDTLDDDNHNRICHLKDIIYKGFKMAAPAEIPKESAAILVDEYFGQNVLADASRRGYRCCLPVEKSGQTEFSFEYGNDFAEHITKFKPNIVKALVRYNPEQNKDLNQRQLKRLKQLSDFCHEQNYPLMLEVLVPATPAQLNQVRGDIECYDTEIRPKLMLQMVDELYEAKVEAKIWKLEGLDKTEQYLSLVEQVQVGGRQNCGVVILGRDASIKQIEAWFAAGANVKGVIGFAVGRTIFEEPIEQLFNGYINDDKAVQEIAKRYIELYALFNKYKA